MRYKVTPPTGRTLAKDELDETGIRRMAVTEILDFNENKEDEDEAVRALAIKPDAEIIADLESRGFKFKQIAQR